MDSLRDAAVGLDAAADTIGDIGTRVGRAGLSPADFGAESPGLLGEMGRLLHGRWMAAQDDRRDEAVEAAARLADLAGSLRSASSGYVNTEEAVRRRHPEES